MLEDPLKNARGGMPLRMEYFEAARLPRAELDTSARQQTLAGEERPNSSASAFHELQAVRMEHQVSTAESR